MPNLNSINWPELSTDTAIAEGQRISVGGVWGLTAGHPDPSPPPTPTQPPPPRCVCVRRWTPSAPRPPIGLPYYACINL